jgi:hypothetical protein
MMEEVITMDKKKYLTIHLLDGSIKVAAFKNEKKTKDEQPDYVGNGVAVWINEYVPKDQAKPKEDL